MWISLIAALVALAQTPAPREVRVTVVQDGKPVAGAEVRWFEGVESGLDLGRVDERALAAGSKATADGEGRATLSVRSLPATLVASAPGAWARQVVYESRSTCKLALESDRDVLVDVVDGEGHPLGGVSVVIRNEWAGERDDALRKGSVKLLQAVTAPTSGRAVLRHAQFAFRRAAEFDAGVRERNKLHGNEPRRFWCVSVDATPADTARADFTDALPTEPIKLVLERTATLDVELNDADDRPVGQDAFVVLYAQPSGGYQLAPAGFVVDEVLPAGVTRAAVIEGRASFRNVGTGSDLSIAVFRNGASAAVIQPLGRPLAPGEHRHVNERLGRGLATLAFRAKGPGGEDLGKAFQVQRHAFTVRADYTLTDRFCQPATVRPSPDGVVRVDCVVDHGIGTATDSHEPPAYLRLSATTDRGDLLDAWIEASKLTAGERDLGTIVLSPATVSVAGVVVDDEGTPLAHRTVSVGARALRSTTDADGRFESYARFTGSATLWVYGDDSISSDASYTVAFGTLDQRVVLRRFADVTGYLRVADWNAREGLTILLLRVDETPDVASAPGTSRYCSCDGKFEFPRVVAGKYVLQVKARDASGKQQLVFSRSGIQVAGGQTTDLGEIVIP